MIMKLICSILVGLLLGGVCQTVQGQNVQTFIPQRCVDLEPMVSQEIKVFFPSLAFKGYFGSLIEVESCVSLKHSRCCSPTSELLTDRELGRGLLQITKAFRADGSIRFDTLSDMRAKYKEHLSELSWDTIKQRPDLQIRTGLLMQRENYAAFPSVKNEFNRWSFADSAYNGGLGNVRKARTACGLASNCDPAIWKGNVEHRLPQSDKPLYGNRSAKKINQDHVEHVMTIRLPKYQSLYDKP